MRFPPEVLEGRQSAVLAAPAPILTARGFLLGGGTGLALVLGHRRSVDFDWFCSDEMGDPRLLAQGLRDQGLAFRTDRVAKGTLHGAVDGIPVTLRRHRG